MSLRRANLPATTNASLHILFDMLAAPRAAMKAILAKKGWTSALCALFLLFIISNVLQRPASHHLQAALLLKTMTAHGRLLSTNDMQRIRNDVDNRTILQDFIGWATAFALIVVALLLSTGTAVLFSLLTSGATRAAPIWAVIVNIAVPTIGLYLLVLGVIIAILGRDRFDIYNDLTGLTPSLLTFIPGTEGGGVRGFLDSLNLFSLWAGFLYYLMFREISNLNGFLALLGSLTLTFAGAGLQGLVGAISTLN